MWLLTSQCFLQTLITDSFIRSFILQYMSPLFFHFFGFFFTFFFLILLAPIHIQQCSYKFNSISLQHPSFKCSISLQYTIQKIFTKLQTSFQNEERNDEKELLLCFHIKFLPYSDTTSILLVGIGSQ